MRTTQKEVVLERIQDGPDRSDRIEYLGGVDWYRSGNIKTTLLHDTESGYRMVVSDVKWRVGRKDPDYPFQCCTMRSGICSGQEDGVLRAIDALATIEVSLKRAGRTNN